MSERELVDARGAACPGPLMELIATIKLVGIGDEVEILSSDKGSASDIPLWVAKVGHKVVANEKRDNHWSIVVQRTK
ncbi:MAG: sulfurtransferase TusA family protein [Rhodospirillales bacterium]|nr:sulfurtransferase TusA family protein [Rhodospirillales bacterium]